MADIILIRPNFGRPFYTHKNFIPLNLLKIATFIHQEYDVKIIDQIIDKNWKNHLKKELEKNPLCVGITSMTGKQIYYALEASKIVKKNSNVPVVWGGIHASLLPKQTLENPYVDILVKGEGEITFYELIKALDKKKNLKGIKGVWYKEKEKLKTNPDRHLLNLNLLPKTPYHLINFNKYDLLSIQTSRGCPFRCVYCYNNIYNKGIYRELSTENTIEEIKTLSKFAYKKMIRIVDDNFFVNLNRTKKIIFALKREDVEWGIQGIRIDTACSMNKKWFYLLESSGLKSMIFGAESGSQRILDLLRKRIKVSDTIAINKKLKNVELYPVYNFMIGLPTETKEDLKATINLALKLIKDNPHAVSHRFHCFTPYPGTELYYTSINTRFQPPEKLEDWILYDWSNLNLPWLSDSEKKQLEAISFCSSFISMNITKKKIREMIKEYQKNNYLGFFRLILHMLYRSMAICRLKRFYFEYMMENKLDHLYRTRLIDF